MDEWREFQEWNRIAANSMQKAASDLEEAAKWAPDDWDEELVKPYFDLAAMLFKRASQICPSGDGFTGPGAEIIDFETIVKRRK